MWGCILNLHHCLLIGIIITIREEDVCIKSLYGWCISSHCRDHSWIIINYKTAPYQLKLFTTFFNQVSNLNYPNPYKKGNHIMDLLAKPSVSKCQTTKAISIQMNSYCLTRNWIIWFNYLLSKQVVLTTADSNGKLIILVDIWEKDSENYLV